MDLLQQIHALSGLENSDIVVGGISWEQRGGAKFSPSASWTHCFECSPGYSRLSRLMYGNTSEIIWYTPLSFLFLINYFLVQNFADSWQVMTVQFIQENIPVFHTWVFKAFTPFYMLPHYHLVSALLYFLSRVHFAWAFLFSVPQTRDLGPVQYFSLSLSHSCLFPLVCIFPDLSF